MKVAVTGAYSYSGKYITSRLLARGVEVVTLTGHPDRPDPFAGRVQVFALDFSLPGQLEDALTGCDVLVNTYWIRFDRGHNTHDRAVENTATLVRAAGKAGVSRLVHVSITNPSLDSPLPYFRGKARNEQHVLASSLSYALLRPTVLFGREDILINNIAFLLRRFPVFFIAGDGQYSIQPVYVDDLAALVEAAVFRNDSYVLDAVGPEVFTFRALVNLIGAAVGARPLLIHAPPTAVRVAARTMGALLRDTLLTDAELDGLMANLLVSSEPAQCPTRLSAWLTEHADRIGSSYASELVRHYT
jgi:uncharacterized protein YbjT (DUF2867 family)